MRSRDTWYMGVTLRYGPDGAVFASDWSDTGECNSTQNTRRETGRIYKISYGKPKIRELDLHRKSDAELVQLQLDPNDWYVQHARRILQQRAAAGRDLSEVAQQLRDLFNTQEAEPKQLRALWALHVIGQLDERFLLKQVSHDSEYVRAWAVRLLCELPEQSPNTWAAFRVMAQDDDSAFVKLHLASMLQRHKLQDRWGLAELLMQNDDANDANIPLLIWYGIEPLVEVDLERFVGFTKTTRIPLIAQHLGRRVASLFDNKRGLELLMPPLSKASAEVKQALLSGYSPVLLDAAL